MHLRIFILAMSLVTLAGATPQWHKANDGHSYLVEPELRFNWSTANQECKRRGLQLVAVQNAQKNAGLDALLRTLFKKSPDLWIGATDHESTQLNARPFYWSITDKPVTFSHWAPGQPDNSRGVEHCVHIYSRVDFQWNDVTCSNAYGYICEGRFID